MASGALILLAAQINAGRPSTFDAPADEAG
jgi:hypothetical protein